MLDVTERLVSDT